MSAPTAEGPKAHHRIGLVVPSSNVTVETEMPALLRRHRDATFSFHSTRMRMHTVSPEELRAMNAQRGRCIDEIGDAGVDAILYACLVALMAQGHPGGTAEHMAVEQAVRDQLAERGLAPQVTSSAGALVHALRATGATRVALVMPYLRPVAELVVAYFEAEGITVSDWRALEVADNT
jgi:maleate isomerase